MCDKDKSASSSDWDNMFEFQEISRVSDDALLEMIEYYRETLETVKCVWEARCRTRAKHKRFVEAWKAVEEDPEPTTDIPAINMKAQMVIAATPALPESESPQKIITVSAEEQTLGADTLDILRGKVRVFLTQCGGFGTATVIAANLKLSAEAVKALLEHDQFVKKGSIYSVAP